MSQRFGADILPRYFYSEIPDIRLLKSTTGWRAARSLTGLQCDLDRQLRWVDECTKSYRDNLRCFEIHQAAVIANGSSEGYGEVEADFLYCFIRSQRPAQIVQVGCGVSTAVCLRAAAEEGYRPKIVCIEPYPTDFLKRENQAGRIELVSRKLEDAGLECISGLGSGDLFFVDSSHTLAPAGEVNLIILEMLPRLAVGVRVHFHDIAFPYDYAPDTLSSALFFTHETALLYAFLSMNPSFEIEASLSMLHHRRLPDMTRIFTDMSPMPFDQGLTWVKGSFRVPFICVALRI
jgi:predicted O-methyltransferase YrrM